MDGIHLKEYSLESELPTRTLTIPVPILSYFNPVFFANKPFDEMSWQNEGEVCVCVWGGGALQVFLLSPVRCMALFCSCLLCSKMIGLDISVGALSV